MQLQEIIERYLVAKSGYGVRKALALYCGIRVRGHNGDDG